MKTEAIPAMGGEKARRLYWACRKGGLVKISADGSLIWFWEVPPRTIHNDGSTYIEAKDFLKMAADTLGITEIQVFELEDESIRTVARRIAGIDPTLAKTPQIARGANNDQKF